MAKRYMPSLKNEQKSVLEPALEVEKTEEIKQIRLVVANCRKLNVRERPSLLSRVLGKITEGTVVIVNGMEKDWFYVSLLNNPSLSGYILAQYTREE